jgi:gliding motility-associated-like protein
MNLRLLPLWGAALLFLGTLLPQQLHASHASGADLSYTCVGPNMYKIQLTFFRDCDGISAPSTVSVDINSTSCFSSFTQTLTEDTLFTGTDTFFFGDEISPLCDAAISTCEGGTEPGVEIYMYSAIVTLPGACDDWVVSWDLCCRNAAIDNLDAPDTRDIYVETTIDNSLAACNNSVVFTQLPISYICAGEPFNFNHGAVDIDGDSIAYEMIQPLEAGPTPIPYAPLYSLAVPMTTVSGTFGFDPVTGQISFTPDVEQVGVLAVRVEEWRDGVLIATTIRDIQIFVQTCSSGSGPSSDGAPFAVSGAVVTDTNSLQTCPGDTVRFSLSFSDPDAADSLFLNSNVSLAIPGSNFSWTGVNPAIGTVEWVPDDSDTGFYVFTVTVRDNNCPIFNSQVFAFDIEVLSGTFAGPDLTYCVGGEPAELTVTGGTAFTWSPPDFLDNPFAANPKASPVFDIQYIVTSDLSPLCKNTDTVNVTVVPDFNYTLTPGDTMCRFDVTTIGITPDPAFSPYTYTWSPADGLTDPTASTTDASPYSSTWYNIIAVSDTGCTIRDSIPVIIQGAIPQVNAVADQSPICPGIGAQLDLVPLCGSEVDSCTSTIMVELNEEFTETDAQTPYKGGYDGARMQILYTAEDLKAAGFHGGVITEIGFFVNEKLSSGGLDNFQISMACSPLDNLGANFESGLDPVFGPATVNTVTGWNDHILGTPFPWDGVSNLLVEVCFDNPPFLLSDDDKVYYTNTDYNSVLIDFNVNVEGCGLENPSPSDNRPNIRLQYCGQDYSDLMINWTPGIGLSDISIQNPIANPTSGPIEYIVTADDNGCVMIDTVTIDVDNSFTLDAGPDLSICSDESVNLLAMTTGAPPSGGFVWSWSPAVGLSDPFSGDPIASPDETTTYIVSTVGENGCIGIDTITVEVFEFASQVGPEDFICFGDELQLLADGGVSYDWFPAEGLSCTDCPDPLASPSQTQTYSVVITSADGCVDTQRTTVFINPLPFVDAWPDTTIFQGEDVLLNASPGVSVSWSPSETLDDPGSFNPLANPLVTTTYTLTLTDQNGCINVDSATVEVLELLEIFIPTAFSPNGDGVNDELFVINRGIGTLEEFSIYNRYGQLVFTTNDINQGWDGRFDGKDQELGSYVVVLRAATLSGNVLSKNEVIQLVR